MRSQIDYAELTRTKSIGETLIKLHSKANVISQEGFTLIELIATLVIISVLAGVLIPRYIDSETSAKMRGLDLGIAEMSGRETLTWALVKLSDNGYPDIGGDALLWAQLSVDPGTNLGADYDWTVAPSITGGTLRFKKEVTAALTRTFSTTEKPGRWSR
jgi:prepilin-type N-terminal cleavage/methylation domain-containing protein